MNPSDFADPAGDLVQLTHPDFGAYWSFLPNPLPPADEAAILAEVPRLLSDANHALGQLHDIGRTLPNPDLIVRPYLQREAVLSSRIEGTQTSFFDLVAYEASGQTAALSEAREVSNYVVALETGLRRVDEAGITRELIQDLHRTLLSGARGERFGSAGELRTIQNHVGGGADPATAGFVPPPPARVHDDLDALFHYLSADKPSVPILVEAAWMHYQFEAIHPFLDGNGRVGRIMIPLLLAQRRQLQHPLLYLSPYFEQRRSAYYDHLYGVSSRSRWLEWLRFFLEGVLTQAHAATELADAILALRERWTDRLETAGATRNAQRLADLVLEYAAVSAKTVELRLGVANPTAYATISTLQSEGILREITGRPRNRIYASDELLSLLRTEG